MNEKKKMKICFISHSSEIGGAQISLITLIKYLKERGFEVSVITRGYGSLVERLKQLDIKFECKEISWWEGSDKKLINKINCETVDIVQQIKEWNSDLIYTNTSMIPHGSLAATILDLPHIWHVREFGKEDHDLDYLLNFEDLAKYISNGSNHTIFISQNLKRKYEKFIDLNNSNSVILNYVDINANNKALKPVEYDNKVDIIIPYYNDPMTLPLLKKIKKLKSKSIGKVLLIDDHGNNKELTAKINDYINKNSDIFEYHQTPQNVGYVGGVNLGVSLSKNDVIIQTTDTLPTTNWVEKLKQIAYQEPNIGTVTPLSNNASIFSIPKWATKNIDRDPELTNTILEKVSDNAYHEAPTAHGFCFYIKREVIEKIGMFDPVKFGKGYGEENDLSRRAIKAGFKNVVASNTYVYHEGEQSFKEGKQEVYEQRQQMLNDLYSDYRSDLIKFNDEVKPLEDIRKIVKIFKDNPELLTEKKLIISGSVFRNKGQLDAVKATNELIKMGKKVHLMILGESINDTSYYKKIKDFIEKNNIEKNIHFFGFIKNPYPLMKISDVVLMCSKCEGFGRVTAEGLALGKPVIGTNSGGTPELVKDGETGFLYEYGDYEKLAENILKLIEDENFYTKISHNAIKFFSETITMQNYGGKIEKIIESVKDEDNKLAAISGYLDLVFKNTYSLEDEFFLTLKKLLHIIKEFLKRSVVGKIVRRTRHQVLNLRGQLKD